MNNKILMLLAFMALSGAGALAGDVMECGHKNSVTTESSEVTSKLEVTLEREVNSESSQGGARMPLLRLDYRP
ncbi:MAG: hypothetical protein KA715_14380 [Xanthomonadaceae bacterium]|nr:hypothetical protein [Xanthomonadaceae bacterium]